MDREADSRIRQALDAPNQPKEDPATVLVGGQDLLELSKGHIESDVAKLWRKEVTANPGQSIRVFREDVLRFLGDSEAADAEKAKRLVPPSAAAAPIPVTVVPPSEAAKPVAPPTASAPDGEPKGEPPAPEPANLTEPTPDFEVNPQSDVPHEEPEDSERKGRRRR